MHRLVKIIAASGVLVVLTFSIVPAQAANDDGPLAATAPSTLHALKGIPNEGQKTLTPLTDEELASVTGAAGGAFGIGGFFFNQAIVVQINVCAICADVGQGNFAALGQGFLAHR
jgi:hypothetical protein